MSSIYIYVIYITVNNCWYWTQVSLLLMLKTPPKKEAITEKIYLFPMPYLSHIHTHTRTLHIYIYTSGINFFQWDILPTIPYTYIYIYIASVHVGEGPQNNQKHAFYLLYKILLVLKKSYFPLQSDNPLLNINPRVCLAWFFLVWWSFFSQPQDSLNHCFWRRGDTHKTTPNHLILYNAH